MAKKELSLDSRKINKSWKAIQYGECLNQITIAFNIFLKSICFISKNFGYKGRGSDKLSYKGIILVVMYKTDSLSFHDKCQQGRSELAQ